MLINIHASSGKKSAPKKTSEGLRQIFKWVQGFCYEDSIYDSHLSLPSRFRSTPQNNVSKRLLP